MTDTQPLENNNVFYEELLKSLPPELIIPSYIKACKALLLSLCIMICGYIGLVFAPWFLMPMWWVLLGTAACGVVAIGYDCGQQKFVKSKILNEIVGMVCLIPFLLPLHSWVERRQHASSKSKLVQSRLFWYFSSPWEWIKANISSDAFQSKLTTVNMISVYVFICIFFPLMALNLGIWGIFKYYIFPIGVYHFWSSTTLRMKARTPEDIFAVYLYPKWVEFLGNNFFNAHYNLPSYNIAAARREMEQKWDAAIEEMYFGLDTFFGTASSNLSATTSKVAPIFVKLHDTWYNFANFKHPGGPIALNLVKERDGTALFESHHQFTSQKKLKLVLQKYQVSKEQEPNLQTIDPKEKDEEVFKWGKNADGTTARSPFTNELLSEVNKYFQNEAKRRGITLKEATKATPYRWFEMIFFLSAFIITLPFFVKGYWATLILTPVLAWLYAAAIAHDAMHFAVSTNWRINAALAYIVPWTASPLMWYHQHVIGHHAYPNIPFKDPDLAHAPAVMRVHPSIRWKPPHKFQKITTGIVWSVGATLYMTIVPIKAVFLGVLNRAVYMSKLSTSRVTLHVMGRILTSLALWGWQWYVFRDDIIRAIAFTVIPMLVHSLCFMISTQVNHLTTENTKEIVTDDYLKHQVVTSHSFAPLSYPSFILTGGLNLQIEHHLFPTVNHCHLPKLHPIVKKVCKKHNIPYHQSNSLFEALTKYWNHVCNLSEKPHIH